MDILLGILIWWLIGFISIIIMILLTEPLSELEITVKDLLGVLGLSIMGPGLIILGILVIIKEKRDWFTKIGNTVIYKKKK